MVLIIAFSSFLLGGFNPTFASEKVPCIKFDIEKHFGKISMDITKEEWSELDGFYKGKFLIHHGGVLKNESEKVVGYCYIRDNYIACPLKNHWYRGNRLGKNLVIFRLKANKNDFNQLSKITELNCKKDCDQYFKSYRSFSLLNRFFKKIWGREWSEDYSCGHSCSVFGDGKEAFIISRTGYAGKFGKIENNVCYLDLDMKDFPYMKDLEAVIKTK